MSKHTPGPWRNDWWCAMTRGQAINHTKISIVAGPLGQVLAQLEGAPSDLRTANARLMAAAPELLEACREAHAALLHMATQHAALRTHCVCILCEAVPMAAAAIAKAEGGQP